MIPEFTITAKIDMICRIVILPQQRQEEEEEESLVRSIEKTWIEERRGGPGSNVLSRSWLWSTTDLAEFPSIYSHLDVVVDEGHDCGEREGSHEHGGVAELKRGG
jgi:hypothetical protein